MGERRGAHRGGRGRKFYRGEVDALILYAEHHFALLAPQDDGGTLRDHYRSIERQTGRAHPALDAPPLPDGLAYLFAVGESADGKPLFGGWFGELAAARGGNGFGANPLGFGELDAWARLTGRTPRPHEVAILRALDARFLAALTKKKDG